MFEESVAKRVRREDLNSPASSPRSSPDSAIEELLRSRARNEFTFTTAETVTSTTTGNGGLNSDDEEETELRLFADAPNSSTSRSYKIRLSSPDAGNRAPGFKIKKPRSYYFTEEPTSEGEAVLQASAIDGKTVLGLSKVPWPGCALPWKVRYLSATGLKKEIISGPDVKVIAVEEKARKRTRKNKKTRIAIRKKLQSAKIKQVETARLAKEKEELEREKRTRRNREKKVKRKAREKAKKALDGGGVAGMGVQISEGEKEEDMQE